MAAEARTPAKQEWAKVTNETRSEVGGRTIVTKTYGNGEGSLTLTGSDLGLPYVFTDERGFFLMLREHSNFQTITAANTSVRIHPIVESSPYTGPKRTDGRIQPTLQPEITVTNGEFSVEDGRVAVADAELVEAQGDHSEKFLKTAALEITGHVRNVRLGDDTYVRGAEGSFGHVEFTGDNIRVNDQLYHSDEGLYTLQDVNDNKIRKGWKTDIVEDGANDDGVREVRLQGPELVQLAVKAGTTVDADQVSRIERAYVVDGTLAAPRVKELFVQGTDKRESRANISVAVDEVRVEHDAEASTHRLFKQGYVRADGKLVVNYLDGKVDVEGKAVDVKKVEGEGDEAKEVVVTEVHPAELTVIAPAGDNSLVRLLKYAKVYMQTGYFVSGGESSLNDQPIGPGRGLIIDGELQPQRQKQIDALKGQTSFAMDLDYGRAAGGKIIGENIENAVVTQSGTMVARESLWRAQVIGEGSLKAKALQGEFKGRIVPGSLLAEGSSSEKPVVVEIDTIFEGSVANLKNARAKIQNGRVTAGEGVQINGFDVLPGEWQITNGVLQVVEKDTHFVAPSSAPERFKIGNVNVEKAHYTDPDPDLDPESGYDFTLEYTSRDGLAPSVLRDKHASDGSEVFKVRGTKKIQGIRASRWVTLDVNAEQAGQMVAEQGGKIRSQATVKRGIAMGSNSELILGDGEDLQAENGGTVRANKAKEVRTFGHGSRAEIGHVNGILVASGLDFEERGSVVNKAVVRVDSVEPGSTMNFDGYVDARIGRIPAGVTINVSGEHNNVVVGGVRLQTGTYTSELIDGSGENGIRLVGTVRDETIVSAYRGLHLDATENRIAEGNVFADSQLTVSRAGRVFIGGEVEKVFDEQTVTRRLRRPRVDTVQREVPHRATLIIQPDAARTIAEGAIDEIIASGYTDILVPAGTELRDVVAKFRATGTGNRLIVEGQEPSSLDGQVWDAAYSVDLPEPRPKRKFGDILKRRRVDSDTPALEIIADRDESVISTPAETAVVDSSPVSYIDSDRAGFQEMIGDWPLGEGLRARDVTAEPSLSTLIEMAHGLKEQSSGPTEVFDAGTVDQRYEVPTTEIFDTVIREGERRISDFVTMALVTGGELFTTGAGTIDALGNDEKNPTQITIGENGADTLALVGDVDVVVDGGTIKRVISRLGSDSRRVAKPRITLLNGAKVLNGADTGSVTIVGQPEQRPDHTAITAAAQLRSLSSF